MSERIVAPARASEPADDLLAERLRGFGPVGILAILAIVFTGNIIVGGLWVVPLGAGLVLLWTWRSRTPWRALGFVRPRSWIRTVTGAIALGVVFKLLMKAIVMPLISADPVNHAFHFVVGNRAVLSPMVWASLMAGFGEEAVFRGFIFERLRKLLGTGAAIQIFIVLFTSAWFAVSHYGLQGTAGVEQAAFTGLLFGSMVAATGRIWAAMIAHAAFDITAVAIIYWDVETVISHWFFR